MSLLLVYTSVLLAIKEQLLLYMAAAPWSPTSATTDVYHYISLARIARCLASVVIRANGKG